MASLSEENSLTMQIWDLFQGRHLFDGRGPEGTHSDAQLLAEMMALLGPPSLHFLRKSSESKTYWDESGNALKTYLILSSKLSTDSSLGNWRRLAEIPQHRLEDSEANLEGENKKMFMQFMRKMLQWEPEDRQSAVELMTDPWLSNVGEGSG
jgi:serine/threonine-protein kinase SRPK3